MQICLSYSLVELYNTVKDFFFVLLDISLLFIKFKPLTLKILPKFQTASVYKLGRQEQ